MCILGLLKWREHLKYSAFRVWRTVGSEQEILNRTGVWNDPVAKSPIPFWDFFFFFSVTQEGQEFGFWGLFAFIFVCQSPCYVSPPS